MLVTLPILLPMLAAAACVAAWGRGRIQLWICAVASGASLGVAIALLRAVRTSGVRVVEMGAWPAPCGISLVADLFASVMVILGAIVGFAVSVFMLGASDPRRAANGQAPLTLCLLAAVSGAFLSGDLFNLYVWFELMLLSSFVLLTLGGERAQLEGAIKYVTLNLLSSVLFLASVGLIYATTGTLNMADLARRLDELGDPALATALGTPLLAAFGIKAAVFPVFFWLPASYHTPPPAVSALFAGLLTKVGVYSIIRASTLLFDQDWTLLGDAILIVAGLTMVSGVLGAVAQNDMRRILSFHIVSQIGYMLMGLGVAMSALAGAGVGVGVGELAPGSGALIALSGSVFYILHHIIVKTNLFLISGAVIRARGTSELKKLGGLARTNPGLAALFLVSSMSLAGIPVLSGFWAKLALVRGGLESRAWIIVGVSLFVSLLTLLSMTKIWTEAFWREVPENLPAPRPGRAAALAVITPIIALATLTVLIGVGVAPIYELARDTATQLLDPAVYIDAVLPARAEVGP